ncbi:hypothetical protein TREMEDRAFT_65962 [Tremella mesenterica DSM 1558]|uniref:uncharacterized protein n=1 Tax=Tremella mesenterica (strain ATCC 24925 / CBS 8224 / DSM 1558 / NBRC 9311 / NRRL Y-6157 / RJB 2259-6 / UBC 559-6) TaxID=578456 RepID=UPI00032C32E1|nr:uncharacterized protein TREMEDRAFT_65962 [Tremella mesenterica DSM 1558]EIW66113.1 hypothetical protein TREMEDRAFT_65962 [Tremella mesenterica DSM 1558]
MSRSAVRFRWQSQPNQIHELLKLVDSNPLYRQTLFPGDALAVTDSRYRTTRDIAIEFFKDNLWIRDAERRGIVIRRDGKWEATALWHAKVTNPVSTLVNDLKSKWEKKEYQKKYNIDRKWKSWTDITDEKLRKKLQKEFPYYFLLRRLCRPGNSNLILPPNPSPLPPQSRRKRRRTRSESARKSSSESGSDSDQDLSSRASSPPPPISTTSRASSSAIRHRPVKRQSSSPEVQVQRHRRSRVALPTPADSSSEHESDFSPVEIPTPALRRPSGVTRPTVSAAESSTSLRGNGQLRKSARPSWATAQSSDSISDSDSVMSVDVKPNTIPDTHKVDPPPNKACATIDSKPDTSSLEFQLSPSRPQAYPLEDRKPVMLSVPGSLAVAGSQPTKKRRLSATSQPKVKVEPPASVARASRVNRGGRISDPIEVDSSSIHVSDSEYPSHTEEESEPESMTDQTDAGSSDNSEGYISPDIEMEIPSSSRTRGPISSPLPRSKTPEQLENWNHLLCKLDVARDRCLTQEDLDAEETGRFREIEQSWERERFIRSAQFPEGTGVFDELMDRDCFSVPTNVCVCPLNHVVEDDIVILRRLGVSTAEQVKMTGLRVISARFKRSGAF